MTKPPRKRNKATSAASSDSTLPDDQDLENISQEENPATATITVTAVEVPELTEQEQSDKPDGIATLTACTWNAKWKERFLRQVRHWQNCAMADSTVRRIQRLKSIARTGLGLSVVILTD